MAGQGLFTEREGKWRKVGEDDNKLPGSHSSAVTCQWQLTKDGPAGRMSKRESHISSADRAVQRSDSRSPGPLGIPGRWLGSPGRRRRRG